MHSLKNDREQELLGRFQSGDNIAFEEIFNLYWQQLYNIANRSLRSHEESEEIVQELFTTLWQQKSTLRILNISSYLTCAVKKRVIDKIRLKLVHEKYWDYYSAFRTDHGQDTENTVCFNELNQELEKAIDRLPQKSRQVFRLNRLEGRSISEIAGFLKISERAIEYHLTKSVRELRIYLKDFILLLICSLTYF